MATWSAELNHPGGRVVQIQPTDLPEPVACSRAVKLSAVPLGDGGEESRAHVHGYLGLVDHGILTNI